MSLAIDNLNKAFKIAMEKRPKIGGFPYLAESLRKAGIARNLWTLPSCQSLYLTKDGPVVIPGTPLEMGAVVVPKFDREALIRALRKDQAGEGSFPEFLQSSWRAGLVSYEVDFLKRTVTYYGVLGESYQEEYPQVALK